MAPSTYADYIHASEMVLPTVGEDVTIKHGTCDWTKGRKIIKLEDHSTLDQCVVTMLVGTVEP